MRSRVLLAAALTLSVIGSACREKPQPRSLTAAELDPWPEVADVMQLRRLLAERRFGELDSAYAAFAAGADTSFAAERRLARALDAFSIDDAQVGGLLRDWVAVSRDPRPARIANAGHLIHVAFARRGQRWVSETPAESLQVFAQLNAAAAEEVSAALTLDSTYLPAYWTAIWISRNVGGSDAIAPLVERALTFHPMSYETRATALRALSPRWGGSVSAMEKIASQAQVHATARPEFAMLLGYVHITHSDDAWTANDTAAAFAHADSAMDYGPEPFFCLQRADLSSRVDLPRTAVKDFACARRLTNLGAESLAERAQTEYRAHAGFGMEHTAQTAAAVALADTALMLDPADATARSVHDYIRRTQATLVDNVVPRP